jgi:hypothetical protein
MWHVWGRDVLSGPDEDTSKREHLKNLGVDGEVILKWAFKKYDGSVDWSDVTQDSGRWRAVVDSVMISLI